ncbi:hypothetical protein PAXRUDRAFT_156472, partial [Paxillus rubicundulus Ve08.2h10]
EMLYKLYPVFLTRHSLVFEAMLSLPRIHCILSNSIVLHGNIWQEFDHLLCYLHGCDSELERQEFLTSILKLSEFYQIDSGFWYAVTRLKDLLPAVFKPSLKLQLGRQFQIHEWVEPSFCVMMEHQPISSISHLKAHHMGMVYFWIIVTTKAQIKEHYRALAYTKPALDQSNDC